MEEARERPQPVPPGAQASPGPVAGRDLAEQVAIVLALSLLRSAVFSFLSLLEAPVDPTVAVTTFPRFPSFQLTRHVLSTAFNLAPVWLVLHLIRRPAEGGFRSIGLDGDRPARDALWGLGLTAAVAAVGLGLYLGAVELGVNRSVIPVPPEGHWWTVPVIFLGALEAGLIEEIIVVGYLMTRLERLGAGPWVAVGASALLRGAYHLYQGWGGFAGNLLLGLLFGALFARTRRLWPLVLAHVLVDVVAGVGYLAVCPRAPYC